MLVPGQIFINIYHGHEIGVGMVSIKLITKDIHQKKDHFMEIKDVDVAKAVSVIF